MSRLTTAAGLAAGLLVLASFAIACGGGDGDSGAATPTAVARATATRAAGDETAEAPAPGDKATSTPAPSLGLESYRYTVELTFNIDAPGESPEDTAINGAIEGEFVAPDNHAFRQRFSVGGISGSDEYVLIGEDAWKREGDGAWQRYDRDDPEIQDALELTSADPGFLGADEEFVEGITVFESSPDQIDGRLARRYEFQQEDIAMLSDLLGDNLFAGTPLDGARDFVLVVWLDDATGALLSAELSADLPPDAVPESGIDVPADARIKFRLLVHIRDIDDPSIVIEPPA